MIVGITFNVSNATVLNNNDSDGRWVAGGNRRGADDGEQDDGLSVFLFVLSVSNVFRILFIFFRYCIMFSVLICIFLCFPHVYCLLLLLYSYFILFVTARVGALLCPA